MASADLRGSETVFSVHTTRPDDVGAVEIIFRDEGEARDYAADRSRDFRVVSASVTRFVIGELGTRRAVAWYVDGLEQPRDYNRRLYPTDGWIGR
jgi:hypothetical protein